MLHVAVQRPHALSTLMWQWHTGARREYGLSRCALRVLWRGGGGGGAGRAALLGSLRIGLHQNVGVQFSSRFLEV